MNDRSEEQPAHEPSLTRQLENGCSPTPSCLSKFSLLLQVITLVLTATALAVPYWRYISDEMGVSYSGLWRYCVIGHCGNFDDIKMLMWFRIVQTCFVLSLLSRGLALSTTFVHVIVPSVQNHKKPYLLAALATVCFCGILESSGITIYGINQGLPDPKHLSWGYKVAAISCVCLPIIATILYSEIRQLSNPVVLETPTQVPLRTLHTSQSESQLHRLRERAESSLSMVRSTFQERSGSDFRFREWVEANQPLILPKATRPERSGSDVRFRTTSLSNTLSSSTTSQSDLESTSGLENPSFML